MSQSWVVRLALAAMTLVAQGMAVCAEGPDPLRFGEKPQVLYLEGNQLALPLPMGIAKGFIEALGDGGVSFGDIFVEQLDLARITSDEHRSNLTRLLRHKLAGKRIALIATDAPQAIDFLRKEGKDLFPDAAVLSIVPPWDFQGLARRKVLSVPVHQDHAATLRAALAMFPDTRRVLVVSGAKDLLQPYLANTKTAFAPWADRLEIEYTDSLPIDEMLRRAATLPPHSIIYFLPYIADVSGRAFVPVEVVTEISRIANAPVFSSREAYLGHGIVGGSLVRSAMVGRQAGRIALDYLRGSLVPTDPVTSFDTPSTMMFDWRELVRWNVDPGKAPEKSVFVYRPPTLWDVGTEAIIVTMVIMLALISMVAGLALLNVRLDRARTRIQDSERRLREMIERAPEAILIYDFDLGWIVDANAKAESLFGVARGELLGGGPERFYIPEQPDNQPIGLSMADHSQRALAGEEVVFERTIRSGDGATRTCEVRLVRFPHRSARQIRASFIDISERKRAEMAMAWQRAKMIRVLAAMDMAGDGISVSDKDRKLQYVNQAMIKTLGVTCIGDLMGRRLDDIQVDGHPVFDAAELDAARQEAHRLGQWSGEFSILHRGRAGPGRLLAHIRVLPDGGRIAVFTDITETRRREEAQRRMERQLEQARKLEALGQLAAGVAHDFNNLLGAILGFAEFIATDTEADNPLHRYANRILKAGHQAKSLIGQILAFSHRREAALDRIDLGKLIDENMSILKAIVAPTTTLRVRGELLNPVISGQRSQIIQLLVNLVSNASEALHGRAGEVIIEIGSGDVSLPPMPPSDCEPPESGVVTWADGEGTLHAALGTFSPEGRQVRLSVADSGDGIPTELIPHIFDPFFTTKSKVGGTGLGLAVVRDIVISHQGGLHLTTSPEHGTRFDIVLPIADAETATVADPPQMAPVAHQGSILLVDDSSHFGDMLMTALFRLGYEISVCDDPVDAIGYVEEDPSAWDLVISDQVMPRMNGIELVAAIKKLRPDLPCILCTAAPNGLTEESARQAGANGLAIKPLDIGRFSMMVKDLIPLRTTGESDI